MLAKNNNFVWSILIEIDFVFLVSYTDKDVFVLQNFEVSKFYI